MTDINTGAIKDLFQIETLDDINRFIKLMGINAGMWNWVPLGGRENNAGSVNLAVESGQALVERITNGMDAHIELAYELAGKPLHLESPRDAVSHLWDIGATRLTRESPAISKFIDGMAPKTTVRVVGDISGGYSTAIINDTGIGQHPDDLPTTILSLGESNKVSKPYLIGAFGQGGSSTFAYCPYSIIISRRQPECLGERSDEIGWTIVRKYDDDSLKTFRYEYLVDLNGLVPRINPRVLLSNKLMFENGTRITHVAYELGRLKPRWSIVGYRYFDNLLFDPVLPYRIEDHRVSESFNRNMNGARNRLDQAEQSKRPEAQTYEVDLAQWGGEGQLSIRYWAFRPSTNLVDSDASDASVKLDSYLDYDKSPRTIIFTLNGQRHHTHEKRLVREAHLGALADYLLLHVDCDRLSRRLKKEIFPATRSGAVIGEKREDLLMKAVNNALADPWLKQKLEDIIARRQLQISDQSTLRVKSMLNSLITVYRNERLPGGQRSVIPEGSGKTGVKRKVHDPPNVLRFADNRRIEMVAGSSMRINLITDAPDDLLVRRRRKGYLTFSIGGNEIASVVHGDMKEGKIPVHIQTPSSAQTGTSGNIVANLEIQPDTMLTAQREIKIVPPPPPYVGIDPPTLFEFAKTGTINVETNGHAVAEINTNARNDILTRFSQAARLVSSSDIESVSVASRGPRDGKATVEIHAGIDAIPESEGLVHTSLVLSDGTEFSLSRTCKVTPRKPHEPTGGRKSAPIPAYQLKKVWRITPL